ncbi:protein-tyrosine-phosphatase [Deinococcus sonorensis]|uniref:Protein-tyrosine-phosphatase n=2 Tax=Deinococcus sonorensis TaxID=309891 RepID=A0AAU7UA89_9DEIO
MTTEEPPLRVDWIETSLWPGHLGLSAAPGRQGGIHNRDLEADLKRLRHDYGVQTLVSLLSVNEAKANGLGRYDAQADDIGFDVIHHAMPDVPADLRAYTAFVDEVMNRLLDGETVAVHGLGGRGRGGVLAASLLIQAGMDAEQALDVVRTARAGAVPTEAQERFVEQFAEV